MTGTNCSTIGQNPNAPQLNGPTKSVTAGGGNLNIVGGFALGPVNLNLSGSALVSTGLSPSLLGIAKLAWNIFNDEDGGFAVSANAQVRDNVFIIGAGAGYRKIWGDYGKGGRVYNIQVSNNWYLFTDGSGRNDVISFLNVGFTTETDKEAGSGLFKIAY